jgi:sulfate/thiosulfate-binding protein
MMKRILSLVTAGLLLAATTAQAASVTLLNASYDPTRELYKDLGDKFSAQWKSKTGDTLTLNTSNGGSGAQARAVIDGLQADIVTLALAADVDAISKNAGLLPADWQRRLPQGSTPYTSTIVFLVRKGNPKKIKDWPDLVKQGIQVATPNPKTSGGARWAYLAAWAYVEKAPGGNPVKAKSFVGNLYRHVPVLDSGARASTITFTKRGIGDVLLDWENEAQLALKETPGQYDIVYPSRSILAEPPVALLDKNVDKHGTRKAAEAFLNYLYTPEAQEIEARDFYRPRDPAAAAKYRGQFPNVPLASIDADFGGWAKAQATHFADGGVFDQIYQPRK